jgi:hypothetical protein
MTALSPPQSSISTYLMVDHFKIAGRLTNLEAQEMAAFSYCETLERGRQSQAVAVPVTEPVGTGHGDENVIQGITPEACRTLAGGKAAGRRPIASPPGTRRHRTVMTRFVRPGGTLHLPADSRDSRRPSGTH